MDLPVTSAPAVPSAAPSELLWIAGSEHTRKVPLVLLQWSTWRSVQHFVCWLGRVPENKVYNSFVKEMRVEYFAGKCCSPNWLMEQRTSSRYSPWACCPCLLCEDWQPLHWCLSHLSMIWTAWLQKLQKHLCSWNSSSISAIQNTGNHRPEYRVPHLSDCAQSCSHASKQPQHSLHCLSLPKNTATSSTLDFSYHSASQSLPCTKLNSSCCNLGRNLKTWHTFCILQGPSPKYSSALSGNSSDSSVMQGSPTHKLS